MAERREEVIKALRAPECEGCDLDELQTWGQGLLIFSERSKVHVNQGSHTRFLPYLLKGATVSEDAFCYKYKNQVKMDKVQQVMKRSILEWIDVSMNIMDKHDRALLHFMHNLPENKCRFNGKTSVVQAIMDPDENLVKESVKHCFVKALKCGLKSEYREASRNGARYYKVNKQY